MSGGWRGSDRKARLPYDWETRRRLVLERCGGQCEHRNEMGWRCAGRATDVDHIRRGDDHSLANLQGLCRSHHKAKTAQEGVAAQPRAKRPPSPHPGLLQHRPRPGA